MAWCTETPVMKSSGNCSHRSAARSAAQARSCAVCASSHFSVTDISTSACPSRAARTAAAIICRAWSAAGSASGAGASPWTSTWHRDTTVSGGGSEAARMNRTAGGGSSSTLSRMSWEAADAPSRAIRMTLTARPNGRM